MRYFLTTFFLIGWISSFCQWVTVEPRDVKKLCREKIRVFELKEANDEAKELNAVIKKFFTKTWDMCEVQFIPHQDNNPEYEKEGFHIAFYFTQNPPDKSLIGKNEKGDFNFHLNFNSCKPADRELAHYQRSLISYDLWRDIPGTIADTAQSIEDALISYTYNIGLKNKLALTLHCFKTLLEDIVENKKSTIEDLAQKNIATANYPILVFNKGDLPNSINKEDEFKKYTKRKVLLVEPKYFKNSKQGFVEVGVVLIYPYRGKDKQDIISVYEINSGKLIGRFNTVLDKAGTITKKEVIQILDNLEMV
ncbi:hypothetical protein [Luteibaculum oceani]|uniref:Uncharacterized protein n=1 Tax=Luteibaculum oceani TaxID=1294296 RepID=A0A5C6UYV0_9FLAO|nr:hypothetical protein [Luteibaculum oceani]TXC78592.1 hypothetical protein FRX97_07705 [Luteibaculum oceani]